MEAIKGIDSILLWRKLSEATIKPATKLALQLEHSTEASVNSDSVVTKDSTINNTSNLEEVLPFKFILARNDSVYELLEDSFITREKLELWIIDKGARPNGEGKYPAEYRRGFITEWNKTATSEDLVEIEGSFTTDLIRQKGFATLTAEQSRVAQYLFKDVNWELVKSENGELIKNNIIKTNVSTENGELRFKASSTTEGYVLFYSLIDENIRYSVKLYPNMHEYMIKTGDLKELVINTTTIPDGTVKIDWI